MRGVTVALLDEAAQHSLVSEGSIIRRCGSADTGERHLHAMFYREHPLQPSLPLDVMDVIRSEIAAVCADFYVVSGDTELRVHQLERAVAAVFVLRPTLLLSVFCVADPRHSVACLLYGVDPPPPADAHGFSLFRTVFPPALRRTAWMFAALVSHSTRLAPSSQRDKAPQYARSMRWLRSRVRVHPSATLATALLVHALVSVMDR